MSDKEVVFEVEASFEHGEVSGNVQLGKLEAHYEALFAEVIDDGIITREERARLDKAADTLGLDRSRLHKLEEALQAAYEARHQVKIREVGDEEPPPASLRPLEPATDQRTLALERRIKTLEARVAELEAELEEARTHLPLEIDVELAGADAVVSDEDPAELERHLRNDPRDQDALHAMFRALTRTEAWDRRANTAHVLAFLGGANEEELACRDHSRSEGLIRPNAALSREGWNRLLIHPEQEVLVGEVFATVVSPVLLGRVSALRRDKMLPKLPVEQKQDPTVSTVQAVRCIAWGAAILGMQVPAIYVDPSIDGIIEIIPGLPPVTQLHKQLLRGRSASELSFVAGRHLTYYREEHFLRALLPSITDLEDIFLAALGIGNPGLPLSSQVKARVAPIAAAIEPILEPIAVDRLRGVFLRFVEEGGRTNLMRWAGAVDRTAARAGLLLCDDLGAAKTMLEMESATQLDERMDDLLRFSVSERYSHLRKQIGIAVDAATVH
jgi:hypothetical protein